jgi:hypothetical protein
VRTADDAIRHDGGLGLVSSRECEHLGLNRVIETHVLVFRMPSLHGARLFSLIGKNRDHHLAAKISIGTIYCNSRDGIASKPIA